MTEQLLISRCNAEWLGNIGGMRVYVSTKDIPEWPSGKIGLIIGINPFKIFKKDFEWVKNPKAHDKRETIKLGSNEWLAWSSHLKNQGILIQDGQDIDPMKAYLMISHLFYDGYSLVYHIGWASYLMHRVATLIELPGNQQKLLTGLSFKEHEIYD